MMQTMQLSNFHKDNIAAEDYVEMIMLQYIQKIIIGKFGEMAQ